MKFYRVHLLQNNVLHFLTDGTAKLMISHKKSLYYVPIILIMKCLVDYTDGTIFEHIIAGYENDLYFKGFVNRFELSRVNYISNYRHFLGV